VTRRRSWAAVPLLLLIGGVSTVPPDALLAQAPDEPTIIQWWHPLAAGAGIATLMLVDEPVRDFLQSHRSDFLDDVGGFAERFKDPEVFVATIGGAFAIALVTQEPGVALTGTHMLVAYALSSSLMVGTKYVFGRTRPSQTPDDPFNFDWFNGGSNASFPSGSAAVVFSLATTLADAIDRLPVSITLYSLATLNAWGRMNSDRHWLSDVVAGALVGITAAKLVNGEWSPFGLRLPRVWTDGRAFTVGYTLGL
jgi:membrane-associated phospholipid phosphatase